MNQIHGFEFDRIEKMGCASHSAADQRIAEVIAELERMQLMGGKSIYLKESVVLLRDGVRK